MSGLVSLNVASGGRPRLVDRNRLTTAILVVALLGVLEAAYLTYIHYHGLGALLCVGKQAGKSSCEQVQSSIYSELAGVPVALLGLVGYILIVGTLFIRGELGRVSTFVISLAGFAFSIYLTYREVFTLKEICEWCVGSAALMTILAVLSAIRYLRAS